MNVYVSQQERVVGGGAGRSSNESGEIVRELCRTGGSLDPSVAELYSDAAKIQNNGHSRTMTFPALAYKELIRKGMPRAKLLGDSNVYSNISYTPEGEMIRIKATRYSNRKKYSSPISLLVGPDAEGKWLIREEISESRP